MCPYAVCLVAEVDTRFWLREALLPNVFSRKRDGGRGGRGPGLRMTIVPSRSAIQGGARFRTKLFTAKLRVGERAVGDERTDYRQAGCATPRKAGSSFPT